MYKRIKFPLERNAISRHIEDLCDIAGKFIHNSFATLVYLLSLQHKCDIFREIYYSFKEMRDETETIPFECTIKFVMFPFFPPKLFIVLKYLSAGEIFCTKKPNRMFAICSPFLLVRHLG